MNRFVVGVDLGQSFDYTAICVTQVERDDEGRVVCVVRHLERYRGVGYPDVVASVHALMYTSPLHGRSDLIIDATGVGKPVVDLFRQRRIKHKAVMIHGGDNESYDKEQYIYRVPKTTLISYLAVLFHDKRFKIVKKLRLSPILAGELQGIERHQNPVSGHQTFTHREGEHDDLVLAAALSAWGAKKFAGGITHAVSSGETPFGMDKEGGLPFSVPAGGFQW